MTIQDIAFMSLPAGLLGIIFALGFVTLIWAAIKGEFEKRQQLRDRAKANHKKVLGGIWVQLQKGYDLSNKRASRNSDFLFSSTGGINKGFVVPETEEEQQRMLETKRTGRKNHVP